MSVMTVIHTFATSLRFFPVTLPQRVSLVQPPTAARQCRLEKHLCTRCSLADSTPAMQRRRALPRVRFRVWLRAGRNARSSVLHERRPATRLRHAPTEERHKLKSTVPPIKTHATCAPRRRADSPPFPHQIRPTQSHTHTLDTAALAVLRRVTDFSPIFAAISRSFPSLFPPPLFALLRSPARQTTRLLRP